MQNRRKHKRWGTEKTVGVYDRATGEFLGCLANIQPEGMMLISSKPLEQGVVVKLSIHLPTEIAGTTELEVDAKCVWSREDIHCSLSGNGLVFIHPTRRVTTVVDTMLNDSDFKCSDDELSVIQFSEST